MNVQDFSITEPAAARIAHLLTKQGEKAARLRISVQGGGCSGFQYHFDFDGLRNEDDSIFAGHGAEVIIDSMSLEMIKGSMLDYAEELGKAGFEIKNPNATANCGCGNSFAV
jgi:iron-sulfur cluster insertion protein